MRVPDKIRKRHLLLTPEERVRRGVLEFLGETIPATSIAQEYPIDMNGTTQRADIVVFDGNARPLLLVECKAPSIRISDATLGQAFRYNSVLGARYVMLTNGTDHYIYEATANGTLTALKEFPDLSRIYK